MQQFRKNSSGRSKLTGLLAGALILGMLAQGVPNQISRAQSEAPSQPSGPYIVYAPVVMTKPTSPTPPAPPPPSTGKSEWTQEAHDAQRTGYTAEEPAEPWTLAWTWNGPDSSGGTGGHFYNAPQDAHTVTGGSNVYVPAGSQGIFALAKSDGRQVWHATNTSFNATPAYDPASGYLYAGGADGNLYKINSANGSVAGTYGAGSPINEAVLLVGKYAYVVTDGGQLHKIDTTNMSRKWIYASGAQSAMAPSYSVSRQEVIFATSDLYVHAVDDNTGAQRWRVKPTNHSATYPYTFHGYWPVVAEQHGIVFLRMNLGMNALWSGPNSGDWGGGVYPLTNNDTRNLLQQNNGDLENLFALSLDDGRKAFVPAVGFGGVEDYINGTSVLDNGPVPAVKVFPDGREVAYTQFRSGQGSPHDGRWDSHLGEMVLDGKTVSGLAAGDMRFIQTGTSSVDVTDESTPLTVAGATVFHAHWGASESYRITDDSSSKGLTHDNPIAAQAHPTIIRRQAACGDFNAQTHWTSCGLTLFNDGRYWSGPGWWVYWNVMDPPGSPNPGAYSAGLLPRYTYVSDGLIIVEGNGGELFVLKHS